MKKQKPVAELIHLQTNSMTQTVEECFDAAKAAAVRHGAGRAIVLHVAADNTVTCHLAGVTGFEARGILLVAATHCIEE